MVRATATLCPPCEAGSTRVCSSSSSDGGVWVVWFALRRRENSGHRGVQFKQAFVFTVAAQHDGGTPIAQ